MKAKKILCALLCVVMLAALAVPAFAEKATTTVFTDTAGNWAEHQIALVADAGIVGGYPDGSFRPNNNITREAFARVVANFMGYTEEADLSQYTDVDPKSGLTPYVARCVKAGVMGGYSATSMAPKKNITREQAAAMLCRAFKLSTEGLTPAFTDAGKITKGLLKEVAALEQTGLITGYADGTFRPKANLTRGQMMAIISRLLPDNEGSFAKVTATAGDVAMNIDAMDDYTIQLFVPDKEVAASKVDFAVKLEKLPAIKGVPTALLTYITKLAKGEITQSFDTGLDGTYDPKELFPNAFDFSFATLKITINGNSYTMNSYGKESADGVTVISTPTSTAAAEKAMEAVLDISNFDSNIVNLMKKGNEIILANGSYLQIGTEKLCFKDSYKGNLTVDMTKSESELTALVYDALELKTGVSTGGNECTIVIKAGTTMRTDNGSIAIAKDMTITFNGMNDSFDGILSELQADFESGELNNVTFLAGIINEFIGDIEGHVVSMNIKIG